jgi:alkylresorcinol/alkylpyrone synthase
MTQILSVRSAFPAHQYPQDELTHEMAKLAKLSPAQAGLLHRFHRNAGVDARHTALPLEEYADLDGLESSNDRYIEEATALGERALRDALAAAGLTAQDVDLLIVTSVTGVAVPSLDARLIPRLGLRPDVKRLPVFGLGCVAGAAGLARLHDYLTGWPDHVAALLSVELCSLAAPVSAVTTADMVVSGLFGDGAAAVIASGTARRATVRLPRIIATRSAVFPGSTDALGWRLGGEGFRIVLTTALAEVVEEHLNASVTAFLAERELVIDDIGAWICHPGGPRVLDAVRDSLKLPESAMTASRRSLSEAGNLSSASVLCIMEQMTREQQVPPGTLGLMVGLGPGVSAELILMGW